MCQGIIYRATNLINGKVYIGKTTKTLHRRKQGHIYRLKNPKYNFHKAIRKYGIENFKWEIIFECDEVMLDMMETFKIMVNKSHYSEGGYNMTWGGDNNPMDNPENVKKMGNVMREGYATGRLKPSCGMKGKHHSEETKRKQSISNKGKSHPSTEQSRRRVSETLKEGYATGRIKRTTKGCGRKRQYRDEIINEIKRLKKSGYTTNKLAEILKVSRQTIYQYLKI